MAAMVTEPSATMPWMKIEAVGKEVSVNQEHQCINEADIWEPYGMCVCDVFCTFTTAMTSFAV